MDADGSVLDKGPPPQLLNVDRRIVHVPRSLVRYTPLESDQVALVLQALKGNVPFCCPDCWFGSVKTAMQCPSALGFTKSCCDGDGCNFSTGDRICPNARNTVIFSIALAAVLTYVSGLAR